MTGKIPKEFIDNLVARIDLIELISARVPLKKTGSNYTARCPFHNEKTPSFSVNPLKQFYYCFGCGASGDAISFLTNHDRLSFPEAIEELAALAGVDIPYEEGTQPSRPREDYTELYALQEIVSKFYQKALLEHPQAHQAREFLRNRGLNQTALAEFEIGYAPPEWQNLPAEFNTDQLKQLGLLIEKEDGHQYHRFRNRIMFPIRDRRGRVVGFGGRVLDQSTPKYLNSPETPIFEKRNELYGLHQTLQANDRLQQFLVVEGYMDVISLSRHGISYSVATLGTASSREQYGLLFRYCKQLVLCFDGDQAGQTAAWRAIKIILQTLRPERQIRIMQLPAGHDPDSLIQEQGHDTFSKNINNAAVLSDFFFDYLAKQHDLSTIEGRSALVRTAKPLISEIPDETYAQLMQARLAELAQISFSPNTSRPARASSPQPRQQFDSRLSLVKTAFNLLLQNPDLIRILNEQPTDWKMLNDPDIAVLLLLYETIDNNPDSSFVSLMKQLEHHDLFIRMKSLIEEILLAESEIEAELSDAIHGLNKETRQQRVKQLVAKASQQALNNQEKEELHQLLANKQRNNCI
ncbi:MAG: DNA primase [Methylococcales bacterium]